MTVGTRRGLVSGAIASVFTAALAQRVGATPEMLPGYATSEKLLPEDAYIGFNGDTKEVTMTMDHYDSLYALATTLMTTTGLSWETLRFDAEHRTLDWDSAPLGGWNAPDSHILGIASVWNFEDGRGGTQESVGPIISVDHPENFVEAFRLSGWFGKGVDAFWDHVLNQSWGHYTLRVYYTTIVPAGD